MAVFISRKLHQDALLAPWGHEGRLSGRMNLRPINLGRMFAANQGAYRLGRKLNWRSR